MSAPELLEILKASPGEAVRSILRGSPVIYGNPDCDIGGTFPEAWTDKRSGFFTASGKLEIPEENARTR
eukprot:1395278-Amorphochlora_amoeboformis.AAC.1